MSDNKLINIDINFKRNIKMARGGSRSRGSSRSPPPRSSTTASKPQQQKPAPQQQQQSGGMMGGIGSMIMTGMAFGAGSAVAH